MPRPCLLVAFLLLALSPARASADGMDPSLSRLKLPPGKGGCPNEDKFCPDREAYERLVADLAAGFAPPVSVGAASLGLRGFAVNVSLSITPIAADRHWTVGSEGRDPSASHNLSPDGALTWSRLEVRKGLPFGLELGGTVGRSVNSSLWLLGAELRAALFEGYRSGLGALPDVAVRGVLQTLLGARDLSLSTLSFDVTLSKPYVIAGRHRLTPLVALQALFASASTAPVDLSPETSAWDACAPMPASLGPAGFECGETEGAADLENTVRFPNLDQTRIRLFLGLEEHYSVLTSAISLGIDLTVPRRHANTIGDGNDEDLPRSLTLHFALGLRY